MNSYRTENYIKDKVIVITGASSGFGKETAKKAAELGGKVVLAARREELLREITQEIRESGGEASYIKTDVRVKDQVNAMAKFAVDTYGRIDVLVNDAGTMPLAYYSEHAIAMEAWEQSIATAINGTLYGIAAVYDQMIEQGQGHIVNISSIWGQRGASCEVTYSCTKAALIGLTRSLAMELAPTHIRVNCVAPGVIRTDMLDALPPEVLPQLAQETPLGRLGTPEDIAHAVAFLAGDGASFITGQVLTCDGGFIL